MANPQNVELEAAKFLHKLIQDSKDEPTKLATKLLVILQHMRSSGKENSMPYQVISRAMETVIKQHGLDVEALMSSRHPLAPPGTQLGESGSSQVVGSSQGAGVSKDPKANLAGNEVSKPDSYTSGMSHVGPNSGGHDASNMTGGAGNGHGMTSGATSSYPPGETGVSMPMQFASSYDNHGLSGKVQKDGVETFPAVTSSMDPYASKNVAGKSLDHEGGANLFPNATKLNQAGIPSNVPETSVPRNAAPRDTGKAPFAQAPVSGLPFKEHHLKQLRAQCLVFLAFRNGLMPKKLHLDIALGKFFPKEEGPRREINDPKGKEQSVHEHNMPEACKPTAGLDNARGFDKLPSGTSSCGIYSEANFSQGADNTPSMKEERSRHHTVPYEHSDERRLNLALRRKPETEMPKQDRSESQASSIRGMQCDSSLRGIPLSSREDDSGNNQQQLVVPHPASFVPGTTKHMKLEVSNWLGNGCQLESSKVSAPASGLMQGSQRREIAASQSQSLDGNVLGHRHTDSNLHTLPLREQWKPIPGVDGHNVLRNVLPVQEPDMDGEDTSAAVDCPPSPKYTTLEKMIWDRQKRKHLTEKTWAMKHQKTEQKKLAVCSAKLKESVTSSEDINAKTKSVIELKKLKLLDLQRQLRSDIMGDFFKPIAPEMDRLKSIKKHRIGRRSKQLERYEQKMKEERQKRIRERQKEFFSELEVHRERLEDVFKMKRERCKGFNKYVREFHKRKERIHREKIDRIQREKINLLKINDVEGYLRMVQDAKSDRVKQLLKETEKYLQKLGSKLQDAKNTAQRFETDVDDSRTNTMVEKNEISFENEDETDQAKHYLESNEKYYMMAHSVKETVLEQPTMLLGGKLREYQMNGLRWLVSLYNNHLNGILADEMGLGKTVQVISLLCYLMETKNDRGPFLVVVPSSVLSGWESEINFWAPSIQKIVYSGPPEERRRLFKEQIIHQKFNVLLTTYEYLMNKHDRPKLSKVHWHYLIIDEGHRIKNASCKLNAELKYYRSNHRLLLTGTPLQNNLEELWALLNFLLPNIFNSSEDFSQWFNKPFESNVDNSADEALLSEEENLLIINRLHQVLRPFVLRRLKQKVENELPEKIEVLIRCEASAYQKLLMKRVEENLGAFGTSKARSVHNSVMELRNICNHPYLSQLHVEEVHDLIPKHYLPSMVRLCGKLEMLDRLLPKLKATDHRVLLFSTMTRLLDVMEDYLCWKQYKYLRLDGHTSGGDRGALIDKFNQPGSPYFIFLLSIRAGGVGVNLQAADTVIIFDTDWNPQVDLQAQARAHRIGQKKEVLVLRLETVQTVEENVRAAAEHKLGLANQSITAGFFDNNTSAEDRREYLESLLRECKKEEAPPVLDDYALNDKIARSASEIDVFESVDKKRQEEEMEVWMTLVKGNGSADSECLPPLPSRLLTDDDLKSFYEAMKISEVPQQGAAPPGGMKRKSDSLGGLDTRHYGRGKRAREVRSYEEQLTEEEFEKLCQVESPESPLVKEEITEKKLPTVMSDTTTLISETQVAELPQLPPNLIGESASAQSKEVTPSKRGRGRPRRTPTTMELSPSPGINQLSSGAEQTSALPIVDNVPQSQVVPVSDILPISSPGNSISGTVQQVGTGTLPGGQSISLPPVAPQPATVPGPSMPVRGRGRGRKVESGGEAPRRRGKRQSTAVLAPPTLAVISYLDLEAKGEAASNSSGVHNPDPVCEHSDVLGTTEKSDSVSQVTSVLSASTTSKSDHGSQEVQALNQSVHPRPDAFAGSLGSQEVTVPNQSTAPASDAISHISITPAPALPGSSVMAGVTQDPILMSSPCPNPVPSPAFPTIVSNPKPTAPADSTPKQGRGRGRKAQSGVEAPRRRGKRQNPEVPATLEVSNQDPKFVEVPEKKSRVSVGRRPTRRNKQGQDALKQSNVPDSVTYQSISTPAISQVADSRSEDEAGKSTNLSLFDGSRNLVGPVVEPAIVDKENEALEPTNGVYTGTSQSIGAPMIQGNKVPEENEAQKQIDSDQPNPSQDDNCLPVGQICDDKPGTEAPRQMNNVEFGTLKVLSSSEEEEAEKQMNLVQTDPPPMMPGAFPTLACEVGQEDVVSIPTSCVDSDASQSILDPSSIKMEREGDQQINDSNMDATHIVQDTSVAVTKCLPQDHVDADSCQNKSVQQQSILDHSSGKMESEVDREINNNNLDAPHFVPDPSVVDVNKDLPQDCASADAQNKSVPSVSEVQPEDVVPKPTSCVESGASQSISDPSGRKMEEIDAVWQINNNNMDAPHFVPDPSVVVVNRDSLQDHVDSDIPQNISDPSVGEVEDVDRESEAQKETDQLGVNVKISESVPQVEHPDDKERDARVLNDVESGTPSNKVDTSAGESQNVDEEIEAQRETDVHSDKSVVISGSVAVSEHAYDKGGDADMLNDVMESDAPKITADPLVGEIRNVCQEIEDPTQSDVQLHTTVVISESGPAVENEYNGGSDDHKCSPLAGEVQNVDQEYEAQKETDVGSDRAAMISGGDATVEHADGKCKTESSDDVGCGLGEFGNSSADINLSSSISVMLVSDNLHGGIEDHVRSEELPKMKPFPGSGVSTSPTEDNALGVSNVGLGDFNSISVEQDMMEVDSKELAVSDFLASKSQLCTNSLSEENSHSALAVEGSGSGVCEPENQSGEEHMERCIVDSALASDTGLAENGKINEECGDDSVLPVSSKSGISSLKEQINEGDALATVSSFVPVVPGVETGLSDNLIGEVGSKEVERKGYCVGSETSETLNVAAAPDSELLEERSDVYCDEMVAEEHENNENAPIQDSVSVLCIDDNVACVSEGAPCDLEGLHGKGDADDSESKATGPHKVPVLKQLTVTQISQEMPPTTLGTIEQVVQHVDTMSRTESRGQEERAECENDVSPSVESLVQKLEVGKVSSEKADAEVKNENDLALAHSVADSQSLGEVTCSTCKPLKTEALLVVSPNEESQIGEDESTSGVKQSFIPESDNCQTVTNTISAVSDVAESQQDVDMKKSSPSEIENSSVPHVGAKEECVFQTGDDFASEIENRNADIVSNAEATCEKVKVLEVTTVSNAETNETQPSASNGNSGNKPDVEVSNISDAEATSETLKILEETTRASPKDEKSVNEVDMQIVEGDTPVDVSREVSVSSVQTVILEDAMPGMVESGCGRGGDDMEILETSVLNAGKIETRASSKDEKSENDVDMQINGDTPVAVSREVSVSSVQSTILKDAMAELGCRRGGDDLEKLESSDQIVEKESPSRVDVTDLTHSSDLVLETVSRKMDVPNAEVVEGINAHNATEICDNNTNSAGNVQNTMDDSGGIGGEASSSLQVAGSDITHTEVLLEKSDVMLEDFVVEVQGSEEVKSEKTVASYPEVHEAQPIVTAGPSHPKDGLQQLVEQYSDATTDMEASVTDSLTFDLKNDFQSSVDDLLKTSEVPDNSALPASAEVCSCPADNQEEIQQQ